MISAHRRRPGPAREVLVAVGSCAPDKGCTGTEEPPPPTIGKLVEGPPACAVGGYCLQPPLPPLPTSGPGSKPGQAKPAKGDDDDDGGHAARPGGRCGCRLPGPRIPPDLPALLLLALGLGLIARRRTP